MVETENVYTSCGCNRAPRCLDWNENGLIAYAACHAIVLYEPKENGQGKVIQTLIQHTKVVTSVQWIRNAGPKSLLLSTSADQTAILWTEFSPMTYLKQILKGHSSVVRVATGLCFPSGRLVIATASADSSVIIWRKTNIDVECTQCISLGNSFALDIKFAVLNETELLAMAGDDSKIYIYTLDADGLFTLSTFLSGHEDWVQSIDFISVGYNELLLVSGSQDNYIRIWKISPHNQNGDNENCDKLSLKVKENTFKIGENTTFTVNLESVLSGHEGLVYSVKWKQSSSERMNCGNKASLQILSASMDKTIIIWTYDSSINLWLEKARFGEIGGNTLGFYGAAFSPDGTSILAHGYHGAIHLWNYNKELNIWEHGVAFGGHFDAVQDISWDPEGNYLLSCSHDQTTRLHASVPGDDGKRYWHELARPQVHGYDMVCLSAINPYQFVSAGDEKILRVFKAPQSFAENLNKICDIDTSLYLKDTLPKGASVPALGLSNKAVFDDDLQKANESKTEQKHFKDIYPEFNFTPIILTGPPTEEILIQNTLWPEVQKLYGHPYEVFAVACNHHGTIVASSCKATKAEHAAIMLWNTTTWKQLGQLTFHALTITQMEFSPDDQYLVSVSRDRTWAIYKLVTDQAPPYQKIAHYDKKLGVHSRIIWSCSWSHDSHFFATASRDKKVAIWDCSKDFQLASEPLDVEDSATAVTFASRYTQKERYILAVGFENGRIFICTWAKDSGDKNCWSLYHIIDKSLAHHLSVTRLRFAPTAREKKHPDELLLASCGCDNIVRIYRVNNL